MNRRKPEVAKNATQSDADEMDEIWLFQAIDALAERDNLDGLMRAKTRLETAINQAQLKKIAEKTKKLRGVVGGVVGKVKNAKKAIRNGFEKL